MGKECVIFYIKLPKDGCVKTRLANDIGSFHALNLYRCFILDLTETLKKLSQDIIISYSPNNQDTELFFRKWLGDKFYYQSQVYYYPQTDGDLGVRIKQSFEQIFKCGYERAVLIGSDSPDLPKEVFEQALLKLKTSDTVIGPANDGGYWLIGFRSVSFCPEAFEGIRWSSDSVFKDSIEKLMLNNKRVDLMEEKVDIDTLADLVQWYESQNNLSILPSQTINYILSNSDLKAKLLKQSK